MKLEDDDLDGDDFDGLWDILGMQGPIIGLLHNTVFSAIDDCACCWIGSLVTLHVWKNCPRRIGTLPFNRVVF